MRVAGVAAARVRTVVRSMRPAWRGIRAARREYAAPARRVATETVVPGRARAVEWGHDPRRSCSSSSTPRCACATATPPPASSSTATGRCTAPTRRMPRSTARWSSAPRGSATTPTTGSRGRWSSSPGAGSGGVEDLRLRRARRPARAARAGRVRRRRPRGRAARPVRRPRARRRPARRHAAARDLVRRGLGARAGQVDTVWGEDTSWVNDALRAEQRRDPDLLTAVVVEDAATARGAVVRRAPPAAGAPSSAGCGAGRPWRSGGAAGCTARWSATGPGWPSTAATPTPAWTPHRTRGPSSSGWGCMPSRTPGPTSSTPPRCRRRVRPPLERAARSTRRMPRPGYRWVGEPLVWRDRDPWKDSTRTGTHYLTRRTTVPIATPEVYADMLDRAKAGSFAYPAINITSSQTVTAAIRGFAEAGSDGIIQVSTGGAEYASGSTIKDMVTGSLALAAYAARGGQELPGQHRPAHRPLPQGQARRLRAPAHRGVGRAGQVHRPADLPEPHVGRLGRAARREPQDRRGAARARQGRAHHPRGRDRCRRWRGGRCRQRDQRAAVHDARGRPEDRGRARPRRERPLHGRAHLRQRARRLQAGQRQAAPGDPQGVPGRHRRRAR